jgi:ankyrin repeat protein
VSYPNPQDAFPLPPRPNLEHYKKQAKALVKACKSGDPDAIAAWAEKWIRRMAPAPSARDTDQFIDFAEHRLSKKCSVTQAQFVIARAHGFLSWPKFAKVVSTPISQFELAADAVVNGDEITLQRLLREDPKLVRARSSREHRATLLHYVSANGVEGYRQKSPNNARRIAEILLDAGSDVHAEADVYGSGCTTLGLVATSAPPDKAGVQIPLLEVLLDHGARLDRRGLAGRKHSVLFACIANGQSRAARFLADRGAPFDLTSAAVLGRLDLVSKLSQKARTAERIRAFVWACAYGTIEVVEFLLDNGVDIAGHDGDGQTGLHWAVITGELPIVELLVERNAPLEARNMYGGTVLGQATWSAAHGGDPDHYVAIMEKLIGAGAIVSERHPPINPKVDAMLERHGSHADPTRAWYGEKSLNARRRRGAREGS